ncbi:MAG TPA: ester cyclase [Gemmatimonadales bacterium]|nr:ester cyclase [Gemmatimonadales bacterium]
MNRLTLAAAGVAGIVAVVMACGNRGGDTAAAVQADAQCAARLATFDTLDYEIFSNQKWDRFAESHASNITVSWPDGHDTQGLGRHIEDLKAMFVYAPDTKIKEHPIRTCTGDYTAVMGIMTGTFTRPMPTPDGRTIAPTGKSFRLPMATIGHWTGNVMDHEWLFWDNQAYMQQIGLGR